MKRSSFFIAAGVVIVLVLSLPATVPTDAHPAPKATTTPVVSIYLPSVLKNWPPEPMPENIPCLFVIARRQGAWSYLAGCVDWRGGSSEVRFEYDHYGRVSVFDVTYTDSQDVLYYRALIDIEYAPSGQFASYRGTVSGNDFPTFTETIVNVHNEYGGFIGANVTKVYAAFGDEYTMNLVPCFGIGWSGYRVSVWGEGYNGQEFIVGDCD